MSPTGVLFLCTGNAARSVMAEVFLRGLAPDWPVHSAGTLAIDGLPTSMRTAEALRRLGFHAGGHRSRQVTPPDIDRAALVVIFEPSHLLYMRRHHPAAAGRTASLPRLARDLPVPGPDGAGPSLADRVTRLALGRMAALESWEEVIDPAGGEQPVFDACATSILGLVRDVVVRLGAGPGHGGRTPVGPSHPLP
jgi:protein-tyrosine-phosphatase